MKQNNEEMKLQYGNWVSNKILIKVIIVILFFTIACILLLIIPKNYNNLIIVLLIACILLSLFFIFSLCYLLIAKHMFSYTGGRLQEKVINELISTIKWNGKGKILDIGCGSGFLTIALSKKYRQANTVGLDYWGDSWDFCKNQCETNARISGLTNNIEFIKGSASRLPFDDDSFDLVVSNMTFHEINDSKSKILPILEAIRVLKKGSMFAFQDLFMLKSYFGTIDELKNKIKSIGVAEINFVDTSQLKFIPKYLKLPFMLGATGILFGRK